jgi:hypothetical protein
MVDSFTLRDLLPDDAGVKGVMPAAKWNRIFDKLKVNGEVGKLDNGDLEVLLRALEAKLRTPDLDHLQNHLAALNTVKSEWEKRKEKSEINEARPRRRQEVRLREKII